MSASTFVPAGHPNENSLACPIAERSRREIVRLVWKIAIATWLLMAVGSATRVMNAGLACPDWPLCYGQAIPMQQMNLQVFLEWFHRLDAGLILVSTLWLCGRSWWERSWLPRWVPVVTTVALLLILGQAALGALTVTELLRFDIVTAHLGMALAFFATLLAIGARLSPLTGGSFDPAVTKVAGLAAIAIYGQSISGGLVGSQWAVHQCFEGGEQLCLVMNSHLLGILPATLAVLAFLWFVWRSPGLPQHLQHLGWLVALLLLCQIALGAGTFYLHLQVALLTVAHQSIGALLLGSLVLFTAWASPPSLAKI
jgi:heme a synthase